ncbi:MAG: hypothetical protein R2795_14725 [Saprospiraceae bacterium]
MQWGPTSHCDGGGAQDAFISSFGADGSLRWWTFFGGDDYDTGLQIVRSRAGTLLISGCIRFNRQYCQLRGFQTAYGGATADAFLASLNPNGTINYSHLLRRQ